MRRYIADFFDIFAAELFHRRHRVSRFTRAMFVLSCYNAHYQPLSKLWSALQAELPLRLLPARPGSGCSFEAAAAPPRT